MMSTSSHEQGCQVVEAGDVLSRFVLPVSADKAREVAMALGATGWQDRGPDELQGAAVVPTFTVTSGFWQDRRSILTEQLGFELGRLLHGGQHWEYARLPRVGELLQGTTTLADITEKSGGRGGRMRLVTLLNRYVDEQGAQVLDESMVLIDVEQQPEREVDDGAQRRAVPEAPAADWSASRRITRTDIVRYAGASGDFNPIHHDDEFARAQGLPSVFSMGLLQAGMLATDLGERHDVSELSRFSVRFADRVWPDEVLSFRGTANEEGTQVDLDVRAEDGRVVITGTAQLGRAPG